MMSEGPAVRASRRGVAIGLIALSFGAFSSSCGVSLTDPCDPEGQLAVVITGRGDSFDVMRVGDTLTLRASVRPITASNLNGPAGICDVSYGDPVAATITWSSQDTSIVRVSAAGLLTARAQGNTEVLARDGARALESSRFVGVNP